MTISRRGFIAGLALTGAAIPAAYYAHRELTREDEPITPGEATVDLLDTAGQRLANHLRGVWNIRFEGRDAGLAGLPLEGVQVLLDIAPRGRAVCGFIDTAEGLRGEAEPRLRVVADLAVADGAQLFWRLFRAGQAFPEYELSMTLDEVWATYGNAGTGTLSGRIERLDRPLALTQLDSRFVATKHTFPEAR